MELSLKGKVALVCGSTQGIGKACAIELALLGASVILMARDGAKLRNVMSELATSAGQKHDHIVADFTNVADVKSASAEISAKHLITILINNTGGPPPGLAIDAAAGTSSRRSVNI